MKKALSFTLAIMFVLVFAGVSYASVDNVYESAVVNMKGDVKVDVKGDGTWFAPWIGMKLKRGVILKTGKKSTASIVFDAEGLNVLKVKENSEVIVRKDLIDLPGGSVFANFANLTPGSTFVVKTPTAACGIRGSGMGVDFIKGLTVVRAFEHKVYVRGLDADGNEVGKEIVIPEGWKTQVLKNGNTEPPKELSNNEKKIFESWVKRVKGGKKDDDKGDVDGDDGDKEDGDDDVDTKDMQDVIDGDDNNEVSPSQ